MPNAIHAFSLNSYAIPLVVVGFSMFLTGLFIFSHNKKSPVNLAFFLICICGNFWFLGSAATYAAQDPALALWSYRTITFLGVALIAPCVYLFSTVWLGLYEKQKAGVWTAFYFGIIFYVVGLFSSRSFSGVRHYFWGYYPIYGTLNYYFLGYFYLVLIGAFTNFFHAYFQEPQGIRRTQIKLITMAFVVAFFSSLDYLPKLFYYPVFPLGFLLVFLWILIVGYATIKYRAMDIETVIHMTLMWIFTTLVAIVPFVMLVHWVDQFRSRSSSWSATFYYLIVSIVFYFYFRALQPRLDHWFQRRRANLMHVLDEFSKELVHLKNLRDLLQSFARMLRHKLFVRRLSIYLLDEKKREYVPVIAKGLRNLRSIPVGHPFFAWLEAQDEVVMGELILADPSVSSFKNEVQDYFQMTQSFLTIPFVLGGRLIGVANLGKKANLQKYGVPELQFFKQLKAPVTIAFSNSVQYENISELYNQVRKMSDELKQWNLELEQRVDDRTRELIKTQDQLVQAEKLATLGTLAGGVAHEINNPLTAVLTNAQILRMTAEKDSRESLELIEEGAKRCQYIVQKLMKYARKTAEEAPHKEVDLNEVVKGTCALLEFQFQQENVEVKIALAEIPHVMGIGNELEQVLTNLLVNARDAIKVRGGSGKIIVETRKVAGAVELLVKDDGMGIPKENLKKIFDPFFTTKEVGAGTGLGLAVSLGILKRHNATISVESIIHKGSTFIIWFPLGGESFR